MICARKNSLIHLSERYTKEYAQAVMSLKGISRKIAKDDWDLAWDIAERARKKSADMFIQLKRHKEEHGC